MIYWSQGRIGIIFAVLLLLASIMVVVWKMLGKRYRSGKRSLLLLPKYLLLVLFLAAIADPYLTVVEKPQEPLVVSVLSDRSSSMDIADIDDQSRQVHSKDLVVQLQGKFSDYIRFNEYGFTDRLLTDSAQLADNGLIRNTDIGRVLVDVTDSQDIIDSDYIIMLTDGGDSYLEDLTLPDKPLYIVGVGSNTPDKQDAAIAAINAPESVELESDINIECDIAFNALEDILLDGNDKAKATLTLEEQVNGNWTKLETSEVALNELLKRCKFTLKGSGIVEVRRFRVTVDCSFEELTKLNNSREFSVQSRKSQIKVLYYAHQIGWEFKAIRSELQKSESVDLTALFRLVQSAGTSGFVVQGKTDDSLLFLNDGFPQDPEQLSMFQCVIIDSVPGESWSSGQVDAVLTYLENGGAVVFVGGPEAFTERNCIGNDLAKTLPFELPALGIESFISGGSYNVVSLADSQSSSLGLAVERLLANNPDVDVESINIVGKVKPAASVVLNAVVNDSAVPLVIMSRYGNGRVCAMLSNTFWKWSRGTSGDQQLFSGLWSEIISSLSDRDMDSGSIMNVKWNSNNYNSGQTAIADVKIISSDLPGSITLAADTELLGQNIATAVSQIDNSNVYSISFPVTESGEYFFNLYAYESSDIDKTSPIETYTKVIRSGNINNEGSSAAIDHIFLNELASKSGGAYFRYNEFDMLETIINDDITKRITKKQTGILEYKYIYIYLFLGVLICEWMIRRRMNLI